MLYTREFFELVKKRLNPGGAVTLFVQLYESNTEAVKSEIGTFMEAFPNGVVWGNTNNGAGYDLVLLGQVEDTKIDVDAIQAKLDRPEYAPMRQSLREIGMNSAVDLFSTFAGRASDLQAVAGRREDQPRPRPAPAVPGGLGLNLYQSDVIYSGMLALRAAVPRRALHRLARHDERAARGHPPRSKDSSGELDAACRYSSQPPAAGEPGGLFVSPSSTTSSSTGTISPSGRSAARSRGRRSSSCTGAPGAACRTSISRSPARSGRSWTRSPTPASTCSRSTCAATARRRRDQTSWLTPDRAIADVLGVTAWLQQRIAAGPAPARLSLRPVARRDDRGDGGAAAAGDSRGRGAPRVRVRSRRPGARRRRARAAASVCATRRRGRPPTSSPKTPTRRPPSPRSSRAALQADPVLVDWRDENQFNAFRPAQMQVPALLVHGARDPQAPSASSRSCSRASARPTSGGLSFPGPTTPRTSRSRPWSWFAPSCRSRGAMRCQSMKYSPDRASLSCRRRGADAVPEDGRARQTDGEARRSTRFVGEHPEMQAAMKSGRTSSHAIVSSIWSRIAKYEDLAPRGDHRWNPKGAGRGGRARRERAQGQASRVRCTASDRAQGQHPHDRHAHDGGRAAFEWLCRRTKRRSRRT
jgi:hypothetical protein